MSLVPWRKKEQSIDPFREMESIQNEMNKLFDFSLSRWPDREFGLLEGAWSPAIDVYDSKDNLLVKADMPGMKKDEIEVSVHDNILIIKGEKKAEKEDKGKDYLKQERFYGSFNRAITLPVGVDSGKITASYKDGVLELSLPKKEESKPKQIKVDIK